jgi:hypothetical protein
VGVRETSKPALFGRLTADEIVGSPLCRGERSTYARGTTFNVKPSGKRVTAWGAIRPSHYKPIGNGQCSRPGCERKRRDGGRYCLHCHALYSRLRRNGKAKKG